MADFDAYAALLCKWTPAINLVSKNSLHDLWTRHFLDSAQLLDLAKRPEGHWVDIGTGGGFPGMVIAILAKHALPDLRFTFLESDQRKAVFLRNVAQSLSLNAEVHAERVEEVENLHANVLSARALAPLNDLLSYADRHLAPGGQALFMKGASFRRERDEALENWTVQSDEYPSITDGAAVILSLGDIRRV